MGKILVKNFSKPDETRPFRAKGYMEILRLGPSVVGRGIFEPGWRWSTHVAPLTGSRSCQDSHSGYVVWGRMHVVLDDGEEADLEPGDYCIIPAGHDKWTVGTDRCVIVYFSGSEHYAEPRRAAPAGAD